MDDNAALRPKVLPANVDDPRFRAESGVDQAGPLQRAQIDFSDQLADWWAGIHDDDALNPVGLIIDALAEAIKYLPLEVHL